jgi:hypothetical protein
LPGRRGALTIVAAAQHSHRHTGMEHHAYDERDKRYLAQIALRQPFKEVSDDV